MPLIGHLKVDSVVYVALSAVYICDNQFYVSKRHYYSSHESDTYEIKLEYTKDGKMIISHSAEIEDQPLFNHHFSPPSTKSYFGPYDFESELIDEVVFTRDTLIYQNLLRLRNIAIQGTDYLRVEQYSDQIIDKLSNELLKKDVYWYYAQYALIRYDSLLNTTIKKLMEKKILEYCKSESYYNLRKLFYCFEANSDYHLGILVVKNISKQKIKLYVTSLQSERVLKDTLDAMKKNSEAAKEEIDAFSDVDIADLSTYQKELLQYHTLLIDMYDDVLIPDIKSEISKIVQGKDQLSKKDVKSLDKLLTDAVEAEDFEKAALIRDQLKSRN